MAIEKITIEGTTVEKRKLGKFEGDECVSYRRYTHTVRFRLYPIAPYTGVIANGKYERTLGLHVQKHLKSFGGRSNYKIGRLNEGHERCPEGYSCKYYELPVYIKTAKKTKNSIKWIEHEIY